MRISGAKNAALPAIAAATLTADTIVLRNMPAVKDVGSTAALLEHMGAKIASADHGREFSIDPKGLDNP